MNSELNTLKLLVKVIESMFDRRQKAKQEYVINTKWCLIWLFLLLEELIRLHVARLGFETLDRALYFRITNSDTNPLSIVLVSHLLTVCALNNQISLHGINAPRTPLPAGDTGHVQSCSANMQIGGWWRTCTRAQVEVDSLVLWAELIRQCGLFPGEKMPQIKSS